jgi:hypothetical protein
MPRQDAETKIPVTFTLTTRQVNAIRLTAKRLGVPDSDVARRVFDGWIDGNWLPPPMLPES